MNSCSATPDLWVGLRADPRRSQRREHDLYAWTESECVARCGQDVHRAFWHARRSSRPLDESGKPGVLYNLNDGGSYRSRDGGKTWTLRRRRRWDPVLQRDPRHSSPVWAYGSIQDYRQPPRTRGSDSRPCPLPVWSNAPGGEGSHHAIDRSNNDIVYSHGFYGNFTREDLSAARPPGRAAPGAALDEAGGEGAPASRNQAARRGGRTRVRAQWMAPVVASQHDPATVYLGYQYVFRSTNRGDTWQRISPDLRGNDPAPMLLKSSSAIPYQTIVALAESPRNQGFSTPARTTAGCT